MNYFETHSCVPLEDVAFSRRRHHYRFKGCKILAVARHLSTLSSDQYRWRATKFWQLLDTFDFWAGRDLLICYDTRPRFLLSNPNDRHHFMSPWATSKRYRGIQTYVALSDKQKVLWNPNHRRHFMSPWATSKRYWGIRATGTILCRLEWQAKGTEKSDRPAPFYVALSDKQKVMRTYYNRFHTGLVEMNSEYFLKVYGKQMKLISQ